MNNSYRASSADELIALLTADGREFEVEVEPAEEEFNFCGCTSITVEFDPYGNDVRCYTFYNNGEFQYEQIGWNSYGWDL